jgi:hypothetical protein
MAFNPSSVRWSRVAAATTVLFGALSCRAGGPEAIKPVYSEETGTLQELQYDANKDGRFETRTFMDGARPLRSEVDSDANGVTDRWEYYDAEGKLLRVGSSSANDGKEDTWTYPGADGTVSRVEISTRRDGKANRIEVWKGGSVSSAEEDSNADGRPDRWETYRNDVLASLALDTTRTSGRPDRRLIYGPGGGIERIEEDPDGDGVFAPVSARRAR